MLGAGKYPDDTCRVADFGFWIGMMLITSYLFSKKLAYVTHSIRV